MSDDNTLCRRCKHIQKKYFGDSIFPIYYCKEHPEGLDSLYMNTMFKKCFENMVTGPWRRPHGTYTDDEFVRRMILLDDEYTQDESILKNI